LRLEGPRNNVDFLAEVLDHPDFVSGAYDTSFVGRLRPRMAVAAVSGAAADAVPEKE
jgi:pyruvate carboxylase